MPYELHYVAFVDARSTQTQQPAALQIFGVAGYIHSSQLLPQNVSGSKNIIKKGFDECYDKDKVNENGRFTNKMLVINKLWCKEGRLKICKISKVNVLTIPPSKTSMSSFPYCQQLLCRQPQIDPMGLKGTYSKINTVLYYVSRVKITPTDSPQFKVSFEPRN